MNEEELLKMVDEIYINLNKWYNFSKKTTEDLKESLDVFSEIKDKIFTKIED